MKSYFKMQLYCSKCKKIVAEPEKHKCGTQRYIVVREEVLPAMAKLETLGFYVEKAVCYSHRCTDTPQADYYLFVVISFDRHYPQEMFCGLPGKWKYHTETSSLDKTPLQTLDCVQKGYYKDIEEMRLQIKAMLDDFIEYLDTKDIAGTKAVLMLLEML